MGIDKVKNMTSNLIDIGSNLVSPGVNGIIKAIPGKIVNLAFFYCKSNLGKAKAERQICELLHQCRNEELYKALCSFLDTDTIRNCFYSINSNLYNSSVENINKLIYEFKKYSSAEFEYIINNDDCKFITALFQEIYSIIFEGKIAPLDQNDKTLMAGINAHTDISNGYLAEQISKSRDEIIESFQNLNTQKPDVRTAINSSPGKIKAESNIEDSLKYYEETKLFLEEEASENALTLSDIYIPPDTDSGEPAIEYVINFLNSVSKVLVISGDPAVGKTSFIHHLIYKLVCEGKRNEIITARIKDLDSCKSSLLESLAEYYSEELTGDFFKNKIILLDGYDEFSMLNEGSVKQDYMKQMISTLVDKQGNKFYGSKIIITTRKNISEQSSHRQVQYITLELFSEDKINEYIEAYSEKKKTTINLAFDNEGIRKIIGVPFILYMVCSLGIDIDKSTERAEVYDKIFGPQGELIKREYGSPHILLENEENKESIYNTILNIAFQMFKENTLIYSLKSKPENDPIFKNILENTEDITEKRQKLGFISKTFGIISYFKQDILQTRKVEFIHRSLQEYFCARYFFNVITSAFDEETSDEKYLEAVAATFPWQSLNSLINNHVAPLGILRYFNFIVEAEKEKTQNPKNQNRLSNKINYLIENSFYSPNEVSNFLKQKNATIISYIENVFKNYWNLSYAIYISEDSIKILFKNLNESKFTEYIRKFGDFINLSRAYLQGANLKMANLRYAHLTGAHLLGASLHRANLYCAHLDGAHLQGSRLRGTNLQYSSLRGTHLENVYLLSANLREIHCYDAIFDSCNILLLESQLPYEGLKNCKVYISELGETVPYPEYCKKYKK